MQKLNLKTFWKATCPLARHRKLETVFKSYDLGQVLAGQAFFSKQEQL